MRRLMVSDMNRRMFALQARLGGREHHVLFWIVSAVILVR